MLFIYEDFPLHGYALRFHSQAQNLRLDYSSERLWHEYDNFALLFHQNDRTPLHLAAQRGHSTVAEFLVDKLKANVNLRTKVCQNFFSLIPSATFIGMSQNFGY